MPPELLQSSASGTEVTICLRGRDLSQREHPRQVSMADEPSSTCLQLPQEGGSVPSGAVPHAARKPAPIGWVLCALPGTHTQCQEMLVPPAQQRKLPVPQLAGSSLPSQAPHRARHAGTQHPRAPAHCKRKAAAGCIAKFCVGSFLATHGISSYCFSSPRLSLQSLCQGQLHLLSSTPWLHRPRRGGTGCRQGGCAGATSGFPLIFPPHSVSTTGSEDTQHCQYLLWGRAALSLLCRGQ